MKKERISPREANAIISSLTAGVVPRIGLHHINVGREKEVKALLQDLDIIQNNGATFRIINGDFGSGKSFLLQMIRNYAMDKKFVVMDADLSPERRLTGSKGQGLATYNELMKNLSTKARPDGGALESILQKWIVDIQIQVASDKGLHPTDPELTAAVSKRISEDMLSLSEMVHGFNFVAALRNYWEGMKTDNDDLKQAALRWIRGEFVNKTEAKKQLPVDNIIDDQSWYDFLKLFAVFVRKAEFKGLLVFLDEGDILCKIPNNQSRDSNYEKLLTIFNDAMQGKASNIGFFMSNTSLLYDEKRGLYSYEALKTRLEEGALEKAGFVNLHSPIIKLQTLSNNELYVLLERLCVVHGVRYAYNPTLTEDDLTNFLSAKQYKLGADTFMTPRAIIKDFLTALDLLHQDDSMTMASLIPSILSRKGRFSERENHDDMYEVDL